MHFRQFLHGEKGCISYAMGCPSQGFCSIIDPQGDPAFYINHAEENAMAVKIVFETHAHADHESCARELAAMTDSPLMMGPGTKIRYPHEELHDGQRVMIGKWTLDVLHTPGHTPEHVCFLIEDWFLLTGDVLFVGDVGRIDLSLTELTREELTVRAQTLHKSLQRLLRYPDHTEIYPGHYRGSVCGRGIDDKTVSTLGREKAFSPALQMSEAEFVEFQLDNIPPLPDDFHRIKRRNLGELVVAV